jgi:hypothetical protein
MDILERAIKILDDGRTYLNYFENLFQAQPWRYQQVIDTDRDLLENKWKWTDEILSHFWKLNIQSKKKNFWLVENWCEKLAKGC